MGPILMGVLLVVALGAFTMIMRKRLQPLLAAKPAPGRLTPVDERLKSMFLYGFGQRRMVDDLVPGLLHIFVFAGFCAVSLRSITVIGRGFDEAFILPGFGGALGHTYIWIKDVFEVFVLVGIAGFFYRRIFTQPKRLTFSNEALLILGLIATLMITDFLYDASAIALGKETGIHPPVGSILAARLDGVWEGTVTSLWVTSFWLHAMVLLFFLNLLPIGKHFHVITALPNVYMRRLREPKGHLSKMDLEDESIEEFGLHTLRDLSWKGIVDLYTCTECGRCTNVCPANATGKPLSPKHISINLRDGVYDNNWEERVNGNIIDPEAVWSCTTCRACEEACPVFIEYVDKIVEMRREMVLMTGEFPQEMTTAFNGIERAGNPWNVPADDRDAWAEGLDIPRMADDPGDIDYLFWVGCAGSFDDRNKKVTRALVDLLKAGEIRFAILGKEESCTGDPARRAGNEMLFQMAAEVNVETLLRYKDRFKKIVTACPHCFNTLQNEYPDFGLEDIEVIHHSELVSDLVASGKLKLEANGTERVVFHDPCYLGRYNDKYDAPRAVLDAVPNSERVEVELSGRNSRCCGAGGARMFMEENIGTRMNENRVNDLIQAEPETIAVSCPFCMTMIRDGVTQLEADGVEVKDIAEVLAARLPGGERGA